MKKAIYILIAIFILFCLTSCKNNISKDEMRFIHNIYMNNIVDIDGINVFDFFSDKYYKYEATIISSDEIKIVTENVSYYLEFSDDLYNNKRTIDKFTCKRYATAVYFNVPKKYHVTMNSVFDGRILSQSLVGHSVEGDDSNEIINETRFFNIYNTGARLETKYYYSQLIPLNLLFRTLLTNKVQTLNQSYKYQKEALKNNNGLFYGKTNQTKTLYTYRDLFSIDLDLNNNNLCSYVISDNYESINKMHVDNNYTLESLQRIYNYIYKDDILFQYQDYRDINYIDDWHNDEFLNVFSYILSKFQSYYINEQFVKTVKEEIKSFEMIDDFSKTNLYNEYIVNTLLIYE